MLAIGHQVLPTQSLPREVHLLKGAKCPTHVPRSLYLPYLQPKGTSC